MSKELTTEMLDELRTEITSYFEAYYSALRNEIAGHDALYDSIPHYFKGEQRSGDELLSGWGSYSAQSGRDRAGFLRFRVGARYPG